MKKSVLALTVLAVVFVGCARQSSDKSNLPVNAYNIVDMGNGWVSFKMDFEDRTDTFLYHTNGIGNTQMECITKIKEEPRQ